MRGSLLLLLLLGQMTAEPLVVQQQQGFPSQQGRSGGGGRTSWELRGVVSRLDGSDVVPLPGARVVLHRIGTEQGPVDSVNANARGEFRLVVRSTEADTAHYLLTSSRHGVAYVAQLGRVADLDSANADVLVFDTTAVPVPISVVHRHLVVMAPVMGAERRVLEVFGIANDSTVTRVSAGAESPVWSRPLPAGANDFVAGALGANPHSLVVEDGEVRMFGPLAPGVHEIEYSYTLPHSAFPLEAGVERDTEWLEVILEEAGASALGGGLVDGGVLNLIGKNFFHHYTVSNVADSGTITIAVPEGAPFSLANYLTIVVSIVGTGMLVALAIAFRRRGRVAAGVPAPAAALAPRLSRAELLAQQIADLDRAHGGNSGGDEQATTAYHAERARLKRKLAALVAREEGSA